MTSSPEEGDEGIIPSEGKEFRPSCSWKISVPVQDQYPWAPLSWSKLSQRLLLHSFCNHTTELKSMSGWDKWSKLSKVWAGCHACQVLIPTSRCIVRHFQQERNMAVKWTWLNRIMINFLHKSVFLLFRFWAWRRKVLKLESKPCLHHPSWDLDLAICYHLKISVLVSFFLRLASKILKKTEQSFHPALDSTFFDLFLSSFQKLSLKWYKKTFCDHIQFYLSLNSDHIINFKTLSYSKTLIIKIKRSWNHFESHPSLSNTFWILLPYFFNFFH